MYAVKRTPCPMCENKGSRAHCVGNSGKQCIWRICVRCTKTRDSLYSVVFTEDGRFFVSREPEV